MDYIHLSTIEKAKDLKSQKLQTKKKKETQKPTNSKLRKKVEKPENKKKTRTKILIASLFFALSVFGLYSFFPQIKTLWDTFFTGPSIVMSFLKNNSEEELKQDNGVTNALLIGIDKRSLEPYTYQENGATQKNGFLSDTIIVASYHHKTKQVTMLSIPRDLWVKIPAFNDLYEQSTKINATYAIGDMYEYENGGSQLMADIVSEIIGQPIHYTARIDFDGFREIIDLLGGVEIEVEHTFDDWRYPREGYENAPMEDRYLHLHFDTGLQHMDGETALRYARSRQGTNGEGSDFARAIRQQKVIMAIREKAFSLNLFENITKISDWINALGETIETNAHPKEMLLAYQISRNINPETIENYVLDSSDDMSGLLYHPPAEDFGGAWILLPIGNNYDLIHEFVNDIFYEKEVLGTESVILEE